MDGDIARTSEKCASLICVRFIGFSLHGHPELRPANNYAYYIYGVGHYTEVDCRPEDAFMQVYRPVAGRRSRASPSSISRLRRSVTEADGRLTIDRGSDLQPRTPSEEVGLATTLRWRGESAANSSLKMPKFPLLAGENTGNFIDSGLGGASEAAKKGMKSVSYGPIPYAS